MNGSIKFFLGIVITLSFVAGCDQNDSAHDNKSELIATNETGSVVSKSKPLSDTDERTLSEKVQEILASFRKGEHEKAELLLDSLDPEQLDPLTRRLAASTYLELGLAEKSLSVISSVLSRRGDPQTLVLAGFANDALGKSEEAERWLNAASESTSEAPAVIIAYPNWLVKEGRYKEAYSWMISRVSSSPLNFALTKLYTHAAISADRAQFAITKLRNLEPRHAGIDWMLAVLYNSISDQEKAVESIERVLEVDNLNEQARTGVTDILGDIVNSASEKGNWKVAENAAELLVAQDGNNLQNLQARLKIALNQQKLADAESLVESWQNIPDRVKSIFSGDIEITRKDLVAAKIHYQSAWDSGRDGNLARRITSISLEQGEAEPLAHIIDWVELEPENPQALISLASAQASRSQIEEAINSYLRLIEIRPSIWVAHNNVAWLYAEKKDVGEALVHAKRANSIQAGNGSVMDTLAWMYYLNGNISSADKWIRKAYEMLPNNTEVNAHFKEITEHTQ